MTPTRKSNLLPDRPAELSRLSRRGWRHDPWQIQEDSAFFDAEPPPDQPHLSSREIRFAAQRGPWQPQDQPATPGYITLALWSGDHWPEIPGFTTAWFLTLLADWKPLLHYAVPQARAASLEQLTALYDEEKTLSLLPQLLDTLVTERNRYRKALKEQAPNRRRRR